MPAENKVFYRGAASTSTTTLYTVPSNTTSVITNIIVANTTSSSIAFVLSINSGAIGTFNLLSETTVAANSTIYIDCKHVMTNDDIDSLQAFAGAAGLNFSICGMEIT